jgi:hypothetical protein
LNGCLVRGPKPRPFEQESTGADHGGGKQACDDNARD